MDSLVHFQRDYMAGRRRFHDAAIKAGARVQSYVHPELGPDREQVATDTAYFGPSDAAKLLILVSGTHGLEGLFGNGCLVAWIESGAHLHLPDDLAVLCINFLNSYGVAWQRRTTAENIDLNRNFVDRAKPLPRNEAYNELHRDLISDARIEDSRLLSAARAHDLRAFNEAIMKGQYLFPDGLYYGGSGDSWSNTTLHDILAAHASQAQFVAVIDYHTGMGPFGYGMLITMHGPEESALRMVQDWYGRSVVAPKLLEAEGRTDDDGPAAEGHLQGGIQKMLPDATVVYVALEVGTFELGGLIDACRKEVRLFSAGDPMSPEGIAVRQANLDFFYPCTPDWLEMGLARSTQITRQAVAGLSGL